MNELKKLFEAWYKEQSPDNADVRNKWCEIMEYLYTNYPEPNREDIMTYILDFSHLTEQQAFTAGFQQAFLLWMNIIKLTK